MIPGVFARLMEAQTVGLSEEQLAQVVELSEEQFQALISAFTSLMTDWARLQTVVMFFAVFAAVGVFVFFSIFRE